MPARSASRSFDTTLKAGRKRPYASWTFLIVPADLAAAWGTGPHAVKGTIDGYPFRGTASRGEGVLRIPLTSEFRAKACAKTGDRVRAALELDARPRPVHVPPELRAALAADPDAGALFEDLPPSCRRAWAEYVADGKRPETRVRRAAGAPQGIRDRTYPR